MTARKKHNTFVLEIKVMRVSLLKIKQNILLKSKALIVWIAKPISCYKISISVWMINRCSRHFGSNCCLSDRLQMKAALQTKTNRIGWVSPKKSCVFVFSGIIEALPGLLLLHQHVWSPPWVLEVPLKRIRQDLCHLCRSGAGMRWWKRQQPC